MRYSLAESDVGALVSELQRVSARHVDELETLMTQFFGSEDPLEVICTSTLRARMVAGDVLLIDVRPENEFEAGHLQGALSIPLETLDARMRELPRDKTVVAYCRGPLCTYAATAAKMLRADGFDARRSDVSVHTLRTAEIDR